MNKSVTRYKVDPTNDFNCLVYATDKVPRTITEMKTLSVEYVDEPKELVAAVDYDTLQANFYTLVKALLTISRGLQPNSAASIAYEALKEVGEE